MATARHEVDTKPLYCCSAHGSVSSSALFRSEAVVALVHAHANAGLAHRMDDLTIPALRSNATPSHFGEMLQRFATRTNALRIRISSSLNDASARMKQAVVVAVLANHQLGIWRLRSIDVMDLGSFGQWFPKRHFCPQSMGIHALGWRNGATGFRVVLHE